MVELNGRTYTRREIAERSGMLSQFAGVRLMELSDGVERGIRMLEFRTGSGLRFTALVDRALDIADASSRVRRSAGTRRPASATRACMNTKAKVASPGPVRSPACSSPAGSTTSCS
jgi:hypothetical protein